MAVMMVAMGMQKRVATVAMAAVVVATVVGAATVAAATVVGAATTVVVPVPQPSLSSHLRGSSLLSFFK